MNKHDTHQEDCNLPSIPVNTLVIYQCPEPGLVGIVTSSFTANGPCYSFKELSSGTSYCHVKESELTRVDTGLETLLTAFKVLTKDSVKMDIEINKLDIRKYKVQAKLTDIKDSIMEYEDRSSSSLEGVHNE